MLVEEGGAQLDVKDRWGHTPLWSAPLSKATSVKKALAF